MAIGKAMASKITLRCVSDIERGGDAFLAVELRFGGLLAAYHGKLNKKEFFSSQQ